MPKNEVDDFLGSVNESNDEFNNSQDPLDIIEETQEEKVEEVKEDKPVPYHKDEKLQKFINKEVSKRLESFKPAEESFKRETKEDDDDYYIRLIGNDTPEKLSMIREAKARDERMLQMAEKRAFNKLSQKEQEVKEAERQAEEKLDTAIEDIEETFSVDLTSNNPVSRKTRVDFMNFVEKIAPKNSRGEIIDYPDMNYAFETFQESRKTAPTANRAKELATRSMTRSGTAAPKPQERITFENLDEILARDFKN